MKLGIAGILILSILFFSCNRSYKNDEIHFSNAAYYDKENNLISGEVRTHRSDGSLSSKMNFSNGIPAGEWVTYGYQNEIIQKGRYWDLSEIERIPLLKTIKCNRIDVNEWSEGDILYVDIYAVFPGMEINCDLVDNIRKSFGDKYAQNNRMSFFIWKDSAHLVCPQ